MGALRQCVGRLSEREQMVLQLYFFEELNLHEIGLTLDVSAARICPIKREAMITVDRMLKDMTESRTRTGMIILEGRASLLRNPGEPEATDVRKRGRDT